MKKALFWDFDGTLAHSDVLWSNAVHQALLHHSPDSPVTLEQIREHMRTGFTWHTPFEDYTAFTAQKWWERMYDRFTTIYELLGVDADLARKVSPLARCLVLRPENYALYEDTIATLIVCRELGWGNFVLSNNYPELPEILETLGIAGLFDGFVVSARVGWDKPRREIFDYARNLAGSPGCMGEQGLKTPTSPEQCVMIGDNPVADIAGARAAGMRTILVHSDAACGADHVCAVLSEIPRCLD